MDSCWQAFAEQTEFNIVEHMKSLNDSRQNWDVRAFYDFFGYFYEKDLLLLCNSCIINISVKISETVSHDKNYLTKGEFK